MNNYEPERPLIEEDDFSQLEEEARDIEAFKYYRDMGGDDPYICYKQDIEKDIPKFEAKRIPQDKQKDEYLQAYLNWIETTFKP